MALQTALKKIEASRKAYERDLAKLGKSAAKEFAAELGPLIPDGCVVEWTQGTPSYNDGEPCTFSVNQLAVMTARKPMYHYEFEGEEHADEEVPEGIDVETEVKFDGDERDLGDYHDGPGVVCDVDFPDHDEWPPGLTKTGLKKLRAAWRKMALDEAVMENVFGDGAVVRVDSRGKMTREDWDCGY